MPIPDRYNPEDLERSRHFDVQAVFSKEQDSLIGWLDEEANHELGKEAATPEIAKAHAKAHGAQLIQQIALNYCQGGQTDPEVLSMAENGTVKSHAPSHASVVGYRALFYVAFLAEVTLAIGITILGNLGNGASIFVLMSIMLALGGLALGRGLGGALLRKWPRTLPRALQGLAAGGQENPAKDYLLVSIGAIAVVGISFLRTIGEKGADALFVVAIPLLLALLITLFEALHFLAAAKYEKLQVIMGEAQKWWATRNHERGCRATYPSHYEAKVEALAMTLERALTLEKRT